MRCPILSGYRPSEFLTMYVLRSGRNAGWLPVGNQVKGVGVRLVPGPVASTSAVSAESGGTAMPDRRRA